MPKQLGGIKDLLLSGLLLLHLGRKGNWHRGSNLNIEIPLSVSHLLGVSMCIYESQQFEKWFLEDTYMWWGVTIIRMSTFWQFSNLFIDHEI
jgi:hypothetical protein